MEYSRETPPIHRVRLSAAARMFSFVVDVRELYQGSGRLVSRNLLDWCADNAFLPTNRTRPVQLHSKSHRSHLESWPFSSTGSRDRAPLGRRTTADRCTLATSGGSARNLSLPTAPRNRANLNRTAAGYRAGSRVGCHTERIRRSRTMALLKKHPHSCNVTYFASSTKFHPVTNEQRSTGKNTKPCGLHRDVNIKGTRVPM